MDEVLLNALDDGWWYIVSYYIVPEEAWFVYRKGISLDIFYHFLFILQKQKICRLDVHGSPKMMCFVFCYLFIKCYGY